MPTPSPSNRMRWIKWSLAGHRQNPWVISRGSLTEKLQKATRRFAVHPAHIPHARIQPDERARLGLRASALVREVFLVCDGRPVVFAHSILPYASMRGPWCSLRVIGNKPLGGTLFADPKVRRTPLEYKKLTRNHVLFHRALQGRETKPPFLWARRSIFSLNNARILVTEIFLPEVFAL